MDHDSKTARDSEAVAVELLETLRTLRKVLGEYPPDSPPESPPPDEAHRVATEYTIPAILAALEATVRSLELLQTTIQGIETTEGDQNIAGRNTHRGDGRSATPVDRISSVLDGLDDAIETERDDTASGDIVAEVQAIEEELADAIEAMDRTGRIRNVAVDVEAELQSIKEEQQEDPS